jgi:3-oxoacyl-[acyl-carrier protein] reductase
VGRLLHIVVIMDVNFGEHLKMDRLLEGKTALITGANKGIGLAIAISFATHGANVIVAIRKEAPGIAELIAREANVSHSMIRVLSLDLEKIESIKDLTSTLISEGKRIDILVNNAGYATGSRVQLTSRDEIERSLQINFIGPMLLTQRLLRFLGSSTSSEQGASVINISTSAVKFPGVGMAAYSASKSAMEQGSKVLAKETSLSNIRVNVIAPGPVETEMLDLMDSESKKNLIESTWMKRSAKAHEIASVALFLASDLSSYVTGQTIHVNGGMG